ncbi:MAG: hypothetical protein JWP13_947 [Candidatus Saccharibacteria bacterium]|nr:hypothetical protein [Candidatus Saccharibacteria bacterium]
MSKKRTDSSEDKLINNMALGMCYGILAGSILGLTALDNIGAGIAIGLPLGAGLGALYTESSRRK